MAQQSSIEWTDSTWNPVTGCSKISQGCKHCYAERMAKRLKAMGVARYQNEFELTLQPDLIDVPLKWSKPKMIFVNSMSDLFHESIPLKYIVQVFDVMNRAHWHIFQILTKRSDRLIELSERLTWSDNIWMGVSVENEDVIKRVNHLAKVPAKVRFLSCEPLLGPISKLPLDGIHWVIVGGESGPGARPINSSWVEEIQRQCFLSHVPFFFKQWGGFRKHDKGRLLNGKTFDELPNAVFHHPSSQEILGDQTTSA
jgi:protein gp37